MLARVHKAENMNDGVRAPIASCRSCGSVCRYCGRSTRTIRRAPSAELPPHPQGLAEKPWHTSWCGCRCRSPRWPAHTPPPSSVSSCSSPLQDVRQQSRTCLTCSTEPCPPCKHEAKSGQAMAERSAGFLPHRPTTRHATSRRSQIRKTKPILMQLSFRTECFGLPKMLSRPAAYPAGRQTPPAAQ
jgi:hypothetical protein